MKQILSVAAMRESVKLAIQGGISARELVYRAGKAVFDAFDWQGRTAVVCGEGNNGSIGYVLALLLKQAGLNPRLLLSDKRSDEGEYYYGKCVEAGVERELCSTESDLSGYDNIADCIFGIGFHGAAQGLYALMIDRINSSSARVVSVDINSGLNGDNGLCESCVVSDLTVSIGCFQPGLFLNMAKDKMKRVINADIGIKPVGRGFALCEAEDFRDILKKRPSYCSKGDFGYVALIGGCAEYLGAMKLANISCAALRAGCGVARLVIPRSLASGIGQYILESTLSFISDEDGRMLYRPEELDAAIQRMAAVSVGMGWGRGADNVKILAHILESCPAPVIVDADGLNTLAEMDMGILKGRKTLLTPHLKEFERLSALDREQILKNPVSVAEEFAARYGCVLLLKGATTIITDGSETYLVNRGCPGMASAGSGDVLSGILTGLLGYSRFEPLTAACGAYIAGLAAEYAQKETGAISMTSSDTVRAIPLAVRLLSEA